MYAADDAAEEARVADAAEVAAVWTLVNGDETGEEVDGGEAQEQRTMEEGLVEHRIATELEERGGGAA
jgi:hypothetical protein